MASGYAITTLVVFIISMFFVIRPYTIPTPRPTPRIPINLTTAPIFAIALLWAAECLDLAVIHNGIIGTEGVKPYTIPILFFSLAYVATTVNTTGIVRAALFWVSNKGGQSGWKVYLYCYLMLTLLSILLGNDPVTRSGIEFLVYYTEASRLEPRPWIMAEFAAANIASMVLFVGNPTNVVICEGFGVNNTAFTAYAILPFLACNLFCFGTLAFQYRHQVPRRLLRTAHRHPRSALLDPFGAWVGSFMLGTTIILSLVVGFVGIDAWTVSLPFAVGKFLFDVGWDHYRYSRGISMLGRKSPKDARKANGAQRYGVPDEEQPRGSSLSDEATAFVSSSETPQYETESPPPDAGRMAYSLRWYRSCLDDLHDRLDRRFPTFITALPRLPFSLMLFTFSQFILVEALDHHGWVNVFAQWLVRASGNRLQPTIWLVGVLGVVLSNLSGTNIGATILLTKVVREAALPSDVNLGAAIALVVGSNIGAVSFTFSASFAGLLWRAALRQNGIDVRQKDFAHWNLLPLLMMTSVGVGVVSTEMAVLFQS